MRYFASFVAVSLLATACGSAGFGGGTGTAQQPQPAKTTPSQSLQQATAATPQTGTLATPSSGDATATTSTAKPVDASALTQLQALPNGAAVASCLTQWGGGTNAPTADQLLSFRTIDRTAGDVSDLTVQDAASGNPEVVLIHVSGGAVSDITIDLANPKAWYCLDAQAGDVSDIEVSVDCHAHFAESVGAGAVSDVNVKQTGC